ncbi:MAG TPA: hypothetical protein V6C65_28445 [Allocoleopsis sp.]
MGLGCRPSPLRCVRLGVGGEPWSYQSNHHRINPAFVVSRSAFIVSVLLIQTDYKRVGCRYGYRAENFLHSQRAEHPHWIMLPMQGAIAED